jgi:hypothetical protein
MQNQIKQISDLERLISKIIWKSVATRSGLFERIIRCHYPIKHMALESARSGKNWETVCIVASCYVKNQNY